MKNTLLVALVVLFSACCSPVFGQRKELSPPTDSTSFALDEKDSISFLRLIDSLLEMPSFHGRSRMAIRAGYNSNVVATSRTVGFNLYGVAPGVSYYHKSGLYVDGTTYYSQQYSPNFYLSVLSGGYMKTAFKHWSFLTEYSHYFYSHPGSSIYSPYTNNLGAFNYFEFKPITLRFDYYFYFGEKNAHRILPGIMFRLEKKNWIGLDKITFFPSFTVLLGSERITADYKFYPDYLQRYQQNQTLPPNQQLPLFYADNKTVFGLMNYSFSAPITLTKKNWTALISYTYNIPRALPDEDLGLKNGGYVSFSITRYITF